MTRNDVLTPPPAPSAAGETEVGRRIRTLRLERGLTLRQLEALADLSATHLSDIERGQTSPTLGSLMRIAAALGREPGYFVDNEDRAGVHHLPLEACRTFPVMPGIDVEVLTLGIPGSRMLAYRLRFAADAGRAVQISSRVFSAEGIYVIWQGRAELRVEVVPVRLGTGDALQAAYAQPHRLAAVEGHPFEAIVMATHALQFAPES